MFKFVRLYIAPIDVCQFRCSHCFAKRSVRNAQKLDIELIKQFLDDFGSIAKAVNFTGAPGNPVLYPELEEAIRICKLRVDTVSINTRGYLKDDILDFFKLMDVIVYYSMDWYGIRADIEIGHKGLWNEQIDTLKRMLDRKMRIAIRTTIMRDNYGDVLQLIRMVENIRLAGHNVVIEMMPYLPYSDDESVPTVEQMKMITTIALNKEFCRLLTPWWTCVYPGFRDRASRWWSDIHGGRLCEAGRDYGRIALRHDGSVLPCPFEDVVVGQYKKVLGKWEINKQKVKEKLEDYLTDVKIDEQCEECVFVRYCGGGCRVVSGLGKKQVCPIPKLWR